MQKTRVIQDGNGVTIGTEQYEVPDPAPTPEARIAELETRLAAVTGTLDDVANAASFAEAKSKIADRIKDVTEDKATP